MRPLPWIGVLGASLVLGNCRGSAPPRPPSPGRGSLDVRIDGIRSAEGRLRVSVYLGPTGFPDDLTGAHLAEVVPIDGSQASITFTDVPAGPVAVSVLHDVDEDEELDLNWIGIPAEDWGVSGTNDGLFGPPSFESAAVELADGQRLEVRIALSRIARRD